MAKETLTWIDISAHGLVLAIGAIQGEPQPVVLGSREAFEEHGEKLRALGFQARGKHYYAELMSDIPSVDAWRNHFPGLVMNPNASPRKIAKDHASAKFMVGQGWVTPDAFRKPEPVELSQEQPEESLEQRAAPPSHMRWLDMSAYSLAIQYRALGEGGELGGEARRAIVVVGSEAAERAYAGELEALGATLHFDREAEGRARIEFPAGFNSETLESVARAFPESKEADLPREQVISDGVDKPFADVSPDSLVDWAAYRRALKERVLEGIDLEVTDPFTDADLRDELASVMEIPLGLVSREAGISGRRLQEALEAASGAAFRELITYNLEPDDMQGRAALIDAMMPRESVRSGQSLLLQQYSTPFAMSFVLQDVLGIDAETQVWEPTAGNGSLIAMANPENVRGFELDRNRLEQLHEAGYTGIDHADATRAQVPSGAADVMLVNPPFGGFPDKKPRTYRSPVPFEEGGAVGPEITLSQQDQYIALRNLEVLNDSGVSAIILGADHPKDCRPGEMSDRTRSFLRLLGDTHEIIGMHYVDGSLYKSRGAGWPLLLLVTGPQRESVHEFDLPETLPVISTQEELAAYRRHMKEELVKWGRESKHDSSRDAAGQGRKRDPEAEPAGPQGGGSPVEEPKQQEGEDASAEEDPEEEAREVEFEEHEMPGDEAWDDEGAMPGEDDDLEKASRHAVEDAEVDYEPRSRMRSLGKRIPANLAGPVSRALDKVQLHHGDIDAYVAEELGWTLGDLEERLAAEQVDAVALAMHQGGLGRGFILGDNTGIGKGRVLATLMAWGVKQGKKPIFVTSKAGLFADIMRDLRDIGEADLLKPLVLNDIPEIKDADGHTILKNTPAKDISPLIDERTIGKDHNAVFMTYSQVNREIGKSRKAQWLASVAEDNVLLLDEVHNAAGPDSNTGANILHAVRGSSFVVGSSGTYAKRPDNLGVYEFTSMFDGTDPETLISTVAGGGTEYQEVLSTMLAESGQMIVRSHQAAPSPSPQLVDVSYDGLSAREITDRLAVVLDALTGLSEGTGEMVNERNDEIKKLLENMPEQVRKQHNHWQSRRLNFGSVMHNVVRQAMFAMKTKGVVDEVKRAIGEGRRVVVGIDNTMESYLTGVMQDIAIEMAQTADSTDSDANLVDPLKDGESKSRGVPANITYRDTIHRMLNRLIMIEDTDRYGNVSKAPAFNVERMRADYEEGVLMERIASGKADQEDQLAMAYFESEQLIDELPEDLPASPIDYIRHELEKAGIVSGEITGRSLRIDYSDEENGPVFAKRTKEDRDRLKVAERFNHADCQVIFVNSSGAEGVSLHGHKDFTNNEDREMLFAQIPYDISTYNQLAGRIDRSGAREGYTPHYRLLGLDIPAEKRQMANLIRKDSSLKANTRADREGKVEMYGVPMMNRVGDQVAFETLRDLPNVDSICDKLGVDIKQEGEKFSATSFAAGIGNDTGLYSKVMSRLSRMQLSEAEPIVEQMEDAYLQRIEKLDRDGNNPMKTRILDLGAEFTDEIYEIIPKSGPSSFQASVEGRQIQFKEEVSPIALEVVQASISGNLERLQKIGLGEYPIQGKWAEIAEKQDREIRRQAESRCRGLYEEMVAENGKSGAPEAFREMVMKRPGALRLDDSHKDALRAIVQRHRTMQLLRDGLGIGVKVKGVPLDALGFELEREKSDFVITGIKPPRPTENPAAASNWTITMMSPDGEVGAMRLSMSQMMTLMAENPSIQFSLDPVSPDDLEATFHENREAYTETRRQIVLMGNLFAAAGAAEKAREANGGMGKPVPGVFTDSNGIKHRGILMPRWFSPSDLEMLRDVDFTVSKPDVAMAYLDHLVDAAPKQARKVELYSTNAWYSVCGARLNSKPDALGSGVRLTRDSTTREWTIEISKKKKDNAGYLKDGVLAEMLVGDFESSTDYLDRNKMSARLRSNALLPDLVERLMVHHRINFHGSHHDSEWHREHLRERGKILQEQEDSLEKGMAKPRATVEQLPLDQGRDGFVAEMEGAFQLRGRTPSPLPSM